MMVADRVPLLSRDPSGKSLFDNLQDPVPVTTSCPTTMPIVTQDLVMVTEEVLVTEAGMVIASQTVTTGRPPQTTTGLTMIRRSTLSGALRNPDTQGTM